MAKKTNRPAFGERLIGAAKEVVAHAKGEANRVEVRVPEHVDVKAIRTRQGLSQSAFAKRYGLSLDSVQNWENSRRPPLGAARVLLTVIDKNPDAVTAALAAA